MPGKFELYKDRAGEYCLRLKATKGQNILASEGYQSKGSAEDGIESVMNNAAGLVTVTAERVDFSPPFFSDVNEIVVTRKGVKRAGDLCP